MVDREIRQAMEDGQIKIDPPPKRINPASVDFTLAPQIIHLERALLTEIDLSKEFPREMAKLYTFDAEEGFVIHPGELYLCCTVEWITLGPDIVMSLENKSTLARAGLIPHTAAGFFDPGWDGQGTGEMHNLGPVPIRIKPGMFFAQGVFYRTDMSAEEPYGSASRGSLYHGSNGPVVPSFRNLFPKNWNPEDWRR